MGMRINTNSWHYRLNRSNYGSDVPKSLCPYFWASLLSILVLSWLGPLIGALDKAFGNISLPKFNIGLFRYLDKHGRKVPYFLSAGLIAFGAYGFFAMNEVVGLWNIGLGSGLIVWSKYSGLFFKHAIKTKTSYKIPTRNQPSIIKEYIKARHHSVCPTLEFVDFEKENFNDSVKKIELSKLSKLAEGNSIASFVLKKYELETEEESKKEVRKVIKDLDKQNYDLTD